MDTKINETLALADNIQSVEPNPELYHKIQLALNSDKQQWLVIHPITMWLAAAGICILLVANGVAVFSKVVDTDQSSSRKSALASEYFSYLNENNY